MGAVTVSEAAPVETSARGYAWQPAPLPHFIANMDNGSRRTVAAENLPHDEPWTAFRGGKSRSALGATTPGEVIAGVRRLNELFDAFDSALDMALECAIADEMDPPKRDTWIFAWCILVIHTAAVPVPLPLLSPLQLGGLSAEWHTRGMNIELRFRGFNDVFVVIEDARNEVSEYHGRDPALSIAAAALNRLAERIT